MAAPHLAWPPRDILLAGALFLSLILLGVLLFVGLELWRSRAVARRALRELRSAYARRVRTAISRALWRERTKQTPPATPQALRAGRVHLHETLVAPRPAELRPPPLPEEDLRGLDWNDDFDETDPLPFDRRMTRPLRRPPDES